MACLPPVINRGIRVIERPGCPGPVSLLGGGGACRHIPAHLERPRPAQGVTEVYGGMDEVLEIRKRKQEEARRAKSSTFWGSWDSDSTTEGEGEEITRKKKKKKFKDLVELGVDSDSE